MSSLPHFREAQSHPDGKPRRPLPALLLLLPVPTIGTAAALFIWPDALLGKGLFVATKVWVALFPLAWMLLVDRQRVTWSPPRKGGFGMAAGLGLLIAAVILGTYFITINLGLIDPQAVATRAAKTGLNQLSVYIIGAIYWITLNSLMEEYVWRWFVFRQFEGMGPGKIAVVATGLAFTAHHVIALAAQFNWTITLLGSLGVFTGGLVWSWLYLRYRSVWPCYLSHAIVDAPIFWIGYELIFRQPA